VIRCYDTQVLLDSSKPTLIDNDRLSIPLCDGQMICVTFNCWHAVNMQVRSLEPDSLLVVCSVDITLCLIVLLGWRGVYDQVTVS
jgi:hypothetical protein